MTTYRRFIPPLAPIGGAAVASMFASLMVERLRTKEEVRQKAEVSNWEDEGGSVAASGIAARPA